MDKILEILDKIEPLILVVVPALIGIWLKVSTKVKEENETFKKMENKKLLEKYNMWEHEESRRVIMKIKELCRIYKDRSVADEVMYLQLENGTIATSKLCNMFVTCLAEDDRYSDIPKKIKKLQRLPYSQLAEWVDKVSENKVVIPEFGVETIHIEEDFFSSVNSHMAKSVIDKDGYLIGMVVFNYKNKNFNSPNEQNDECNENHQLKLLREFKVSVEAIFIAYNVARIDMKKELGLDSHHDGGDMDD